MKRGEENSDDEVPSLVDESMIDAVLALSPEERLRHNDRMVRTILLLRQGLADGDERNGRNG